jgi:hypothetical protein
MGLIGDLTAKEALSLGENLIAEIVETTKLPSKVVHRRLNEARGNAQLRSVFVDEWPDLAGEIAKETVAGAKAKELGDKIARVTNLGRRTVDFVLDRISPRTRLANAFDFAWPGKIDSEKRELLLRRLLLNQTLATIRYYDLFGDVAGAFGVEEQEVRNSLSGHSGNKKLRNVRNDAADTSSDSESDAQNDASLSSDEERMLSFLPRDGGTIGKANLCEKLGWDEDKYYAVRAGLLQKNLIWLGKGRGGSVMLVSGWMESRRREFLSHVPEDGAAISNAALIGQLRWEKSDYDEFKSLLIEEGVLQIGKGRGGTVFRSLSPTSSRPNNIGDTTAEPTRVAVAPIASSPTPITARPTHVNISFPLPLLDAYRANKLAVLFGSGLSPTKNVGGPFPTWRELPDRLLEQALQQGVMSQPQVNARRAIFTSGHVSLEAMLAELDAIKIALRSARKYQPALEAIFSPTNATCGEVHRALVDLGVSVLVTTNYDELLEHAEGPPVRAVYTWQEADNALSRIGGGRKVLFKIHGTADKEGTVVMTRREYDDAARHQGYQQTMRHLLQSYTFLLIGYGINDPYDLDLAFGLNISAFGCATNAHYALMKDAQNTDIDRWQRELNVQVVPYQDHAHLPAILRALRSQKP